MRSPLEIRTPRGEEAAKLYDLVRRFSTSFTPDRSSFEASFAALLEDESTDLLCCFLEGEMCGYVLAFHHPAFFAGGIVTWVEEVYVSDEVRRQGVGTELVHEIEARAAERGSTLVALATRRSHDFYRALGYEESATYFRRVL